MTVLAGALGAGKTTLVNRILREPAGRRYAVIVNEFAELGIDGSLIKGAAAGVIELANGCLCCSAEGDLVGAIRTITNAPTAPDAILVELSGMATPAAVARRFHAQAFGRQVRLAGVVTVVDCKHAPGPDDPAWCEQIVFADTIILNKVDLIDEAARAHLAGAIGRLNPTAAIVPAVRAECPLALLSDEHASWVRNQAWVQTAAHDHEHSSSVGSVAVELATPLAAGPVSEWLEHLINDPKHAILRIKGVLNVSGEDRRVIVHGVRQTMGGELGDPWGADERRTSRLVFIGHELDGEAIRAGLRSTIAGAERCTAAEEPRTTVATFR